MTKLSGSLPNGDWNGLPALARALIEHPTKTAIIVAVVDCKSITTNTDSGDQVATVRIRRIEPIDPSDTEAAQRLFVRGLECRTGAVMLPMDLEDELDGLFKSLIGSVDFETGELIDGEPEQQPEPDDAPAPEKPKRSRAAKKALDDLPTEIEPFTDNVIQLPTYGEVQAAKDAEREALEIIFSAPDKAPTKPSMAEELAATNAAALAEFQHKTETPEPVAVVKPKRSHKKKVAEPEPDIVGDDSPPWL